MWIAKKPFEAFVGALVLYYILIVFWFEPLGLSVKFDFITSGFFVWIFFYFVGLAFGKELGKAKNRLIELIQDIHIGKNISIKFFHLTMFCLPFLILLSLLEYASSSMFIAGGDVAIGFPLSSYSFSTGKILIGNLAVNLILYTSTIYFIGNILIGRNKRV